MYIIQQFPSDKKRKQGQFGGISVYGLIKGDKDNYFVVISFLENGTIRLETAVKDKDANTYKNKMELSHPLQLTDNAAAQQGNDNSPISIGNIQKIMGIVKKKNYYQQAEGYTGKKDLIAYHNISQTNLDKAIQLGGLAVPSIAVTKKETDFSNFGNITLLMPQDVVNQKETPLAVDSGMYMQTVQQETADTLKEYSTFDKAGMTMHAIREERTRLSSMVKELSKTKDEPEKDSVQSIMDT